MKSSLRFAPPCAAVQQQYRRTRAGGDCGGNVAGGVLHGSMLFLESQNKIDTIKIQSKTQNQKLKNSKTQKLKIRFRTQNQNQS
jgi:hypothetical protein